MAQEDYSMYSVLVVDDIPVNVLLVKSMLSKFNFKVSSANNGQAALDEVSRSIPDVILLDVMMPGMNGFEVTRALRADEATKDVPVIILSALNSDADIKQGLSAGANDFITKPFIQERIVNSILNQINLAKTRKQSQAASAPAVPGSDNYLKLLANMACAGAQSALPSVAQQVAVCLPASLMDDELFRALNASAASGAEALQTAVRNWLTNRLTAVTPQKSSVELSSAVNSAVNLLTPAANGKEITWSVSVDSSLKTTADPQWIQSLLTNFLVCACGLTSRGVVSITGGTDSGYATISVEGKVVGGAPAEWNFNLSLAQDVAAKLEGTIWIKELNDTAFQFQLMLPA